MPVEVDRLHPVSSDGIRGTLTDAPVRCGLCAATDAYILLTSCLHSYCNRCLDTLKQDGNYFCSLCKEYSSATINNPLLCKTEAGQKSPECNWCKDNGEHTKSIGNCKECDVWLCGECLKGHNRMPPLRTHSVSMLPKSENQGSLQCTTHPHEALECFCEACGILTCRDCQLSVHRDHGSHRWVGEKANLLAEPLRQAIERLERCQSKLSNTCQVVLSACSSTKDDSFLGSVEKTRLAIEARAASLILRIQSHAESLLKELNSKCTSSVNQLMATERLMADIQNRIGHTIGFANRLITHKDADPASLVQLYDAVQSRIEFLYSRADRLLKDAPPVSDDAAAVDGSNGEDLDDFRGWRDSTLGWRSMCDTRALFIAHWDPEELARHSGSVAWLQTPYMNGSAEEDTESAPTQQTPLAPPCMSGDEYGEFLDSLATIDGQSANWSTAAGPTELGCSPVGCAICFGSGLLAHCDKCRRAYHLDCHLPKLSAMSLVPDWICSLCEESDGATTSVVPHTDQSNGTILSRADFLAGCRILMGLLVSADAVHFTASVCPACSVPLLTPGLSAPHCPSGHLYHRLAELRLQLEEAASVEDGGAAPVDDLEDQDQIGGQKTPGGGRIRLACLDDWLAELDKFWSDASNEDNHIRGATAGCLRAARRLRATLASLVATHRPQTQASFVTQNDPDVALPSQPVDSQGQGIVKTLLTSLIQ